jgi:ribose transport system permease protein
MTAATDVVGRRERSRMDDVTAWARRNSWTIALLGLMVVFFAITKALQPRYGAPELQGFAISVLPIAFAAVAQAIVVISGGIDLSVGSMMALASVVSAVLMKGQSDLTALVIVIATLGLGIVLGLVNGGLIVVTRVPDIVVTLAMSFVWAGTALLVLHTPGGGAAKWLMDLISDAYVTEWLPRALVLLVVLVAVIWVPIRRSTLGLSLYAIGSNRLAAFRSGVSVGRTKLLAYALTGLFSAMGGLALTASTGIGSPVPGSYTIQSIAAIVLGGVSLAGGRGGVVGPVVAVIILAFIRTDLTFIGVNPNLGTTIQGVILIGVVMFGSFVTLRRGRA